MFVAKHLPLMSSYRLEIKKIISPNDLQQQSLPTFNPSRKEDAKALNTYVSVCMSGHSHISETARGSTSLNFCMLPVAVARSSSDGVDAAVWMTSYFHIMGPMARHVYSSAARAYNSRNNWIDSNQLCSTIKDRQVYIVRALHAGNEVCYLRLPLLFFHASKLRAAY